MSASILIKKESKKNEIQNRQKINSEDIPEDKNQKLVDKIINKWLDLQKIIKEDDNYEGPYKNDFFNKDDEDIKEKETAINKKSRHKKFKDNMNKFRDFVSSTNENLDTDSNLKGSKRETKTKKFFGSNPPRKGEGGPIMSSMVFSEKDRQKKAKSNAAFFGDDLGVTHKRKEKNLFQKAKIKRNKLNKNENKNNNNYINQEEEKQNINQENFENNKNNYISNNSNKNYSSYDERPIGGNKIDYNAMFDDNNNNFEQDGFGGANQEINLKKKIIKKNSPRKKPVYDARKAIEEAKIREAKEGKKEKPSAFREFVKEMKKLSAEEKAAKTGMLLLEVNQIAYVLN